LRLILNSTFELFWVWAMTRAERFSQVRQAQKSSASIRVETPTCRAFRTISRGGMPMARSRRISARIFFWVLLRKSAVRRPRLSMMTRQSRQNASKRLKSR
jgi:hypothetical protein